MSVGPWVAIVIIGLLVGRAGKRTLVRFQVLGLLIPTLYYAVWQFYEMGDVTADLLSPATVDFVGRVVVFFVVGGVAALIADPRITFTEPV